MGALLISSTCSQSETLLNTTTTCLKMMVELMKCKRKKNKNILLEKPISHEIFDYLDISISNNSKNYIYFDDLKIVK